MKKNFLKTALVGLTCLLLPALSNATPHLLLRNPAPATPADLVYNGNNAPVMTGNVNVYVLYWMPKKLQDGTLLTASTNDYLLFQKQFLTDFVAGNGLSAIASQYYQTVSGKNSYVSTRLFFSGGHTDLTSFPTTGCPESSLSKTNCVKDADIQTEIKKIIGQKQWPVKNTIFLVYTPSGEDVCDGNGNCTKTGTPFCGYHNVIPTDASPIVYSVLPNTGPAGCTTGTYPQNNPAAESVANTTVLEIFGMLTNPLLNAWTTADGREIGDVCQGSTITANYTWDNGLANHMWNGRYYSIQPIYDNHLSVCADRGL